MPIRRSSDDLPREYVEGFGIETDPATGEQVKQHKMRVMSPLDIKQRLELNQANTSEAIRARVLAHTATGNGHARYDR